MLSQNSLLDQRLRLQSKPPTENGPAYAASGVSSNRLHDRRIVVLRPLNGRPVFLSSSIQIPMPANSSMRAGFLTSAAKRTTSIFKMMDQSRHRSVETLRGYVRDAEIFKEHAGAGLL
jgi:hypothetical protein